MFINNKKHNSCVFFIILIMFMLIVACENKNVVNKNENKTTINMAQNKTNNNAALNTTKKFKKIHNNKNTTKMTNINNQEKSEEITTKMTYPTKKEIERFYGIKLPKNYNLLEFSYEYDSKIGNRLIFPLKISVHSTELNVVVDNLKNDYNEYTKANIIPNIQYSINWWDMNKSEIYKAYYKFSTYKYTDKNKTFKTSTVYSIFILNEDKEKNLIYLCN